MRLPFKGITDFEKRTYRIVSSLRCTECDYRELVNFKRGDYIYKTVRKCPKCEDGTLYIYEIYAVPLTPPKKEEEI